ncbi:hypothetical protein Tco_0366965 [Tanacetum coccineum]
MDIFAFFHTLDPTKVKVVEREQNEDKLLLLETTIGCTVSILPVAPDHAESELDASVEKLFDEGGSGNQTEQGDSTGGEKGTEIQLVTKAAKTVVEDVAPVQLKRQRKRKIVIVDASEASHPPKKLRGDHGTPSGTFVGGKSSCAYGVLVKSDMSYRELIITRFLCRAGTDTPYLHCWIRRIVAENNILQMSSF